jgi:hypothetical protein
LGIAVTRADKAFRNVYGMMLLFFGLTRFALVIDTYNRAMYRLNTLMHICHVAILYRIAYANGQLVFSALLEKAELRGAWNPMPSSGPSARHIEHVSTTSQSFSEFHINSF